MSALLLVLALLLFLQVRRHHSQVDGRNSSSSVTADRSHAMKGGSVESEPRKPSKVSDRPEHLVADDKIPLAEPVRGQPGFVYHPVTGKIVDVRGVPAGLAVTQGGSGMFVIPKMGYVITTEAFNKAVWGNERGLAGEGAILGSFGDEKVRIVSCFPAGWETRWDDGTPYVPDGEANGEPDSSLE